MSRYTVRKTDETVLPRVTAPARPTGWPPGRVARRTGDCASLCRAAAVPRDLRKRTPSEKPTFSCQKGASMVYSSEKAPDRMAATPGKSGGRPENGGNLLKSQELNKKCDLDFLPLEAWKSYRIFWKSFPDKAPIGPGGAGSCTGGGFGLGRRLHEVRQSRTRRGGS